MNPIDVPGPGAPPEQVIAFLSHQLEAMRKHVQDRDETEAQISMRLQAQMQEQIERFKYSCEEKIETFKRDAARWRIARQFTVRIREERVCAKGIELDELVDQIARRAMN